MTITLYCIGSLKEVYWRDAFHEYEKRMAPYAKFILVEMPDEKAGENLSEKEETNIKDKECSRLLEKIKPNEYLIALDLNQKEYDSLSFASHIDSLVSNGHSNISFVIGGSLGLSEAMKKRANESMSFGKMTFPHQLARVMFMEQLYRCFRINHHQPYHK